MADYQLNLNLDVTKSQRTLQDIGLYIPRTPEEIRAEFPGSHLEDLYVGELAINKGEYLSAMRRRTRRSMDEEVLSPTLPVQARR